MNDTINVLGNENNSPLILFIMWELISNSKLATAGPRHFELQKYFPEKTRLNILFIPTLPAKAAITAMLRMLSNVNA